MQLTPEHLNTAWQHSLQGVDVSLNFQACPLFTQTTYNDIKKDPHQHGKPLFQDPQNIGLIGKSQEYSLITKSIIQAQTKTMLLLGDAGLGKSHLLECLVLNAATQATTQPWHIFPHQMLLLKIPQFTTTHPMAESLLNYAQAGLYDWSMAILDTLRNLANMYLKEKSCTLTHEWFATHLEASAGLINDVERYTYWYKESLHCLRQHQGMVDKLLRPQSSLAEQVAFVCASPWAAIAFHLIQTVAPQHNFAPAQQEANLLDALDYIGHRLKSSLHHPHYGATFSLYIDGWDALLERPTPEQREATTRLKRLLRHLNDQKQSALHVLISTRPEQISRQLGSTGYSLCRQKMLLSPLNNTDVERFLEYHATVSSDEKEPLLHWFQTASQGNPSQLQWLLEHIATHTNIEEKVPLSLKTVESLHIEEGTQLYGLLYTRLQLDSITKGPLFLKAFQTFIQHATTQPFNPEVCVESLQPFLPPGCTTEHLKDAVQQLYFYGVLKPWKPLYTSPAHCIHTNLYCIPNRSILGYLKGLNFNPEPADVYTWQHKGLQALAHQLEEWLGNVRHVHYLFGMIPTLFANNELPPEKLAHCIQVAQGVTHEEGTPFIQDAGSFLFHTFSMHEAPEMRCRAATLLPELPLALVPEWLLGGIEDDDESVILASLKSLGKWPEKALRHKNSLPVETQHHVVQQLLSYLQHPLIQTPTLCNALFGTLGQWARFAPTELLQALKEAFFSPHEAPSHDETEGSLKALRPLDAMPFSNGVFQLLHACQRHLPTVALAESQALSLRLITLHWKQDSILHPESITLFCALPPELPGLLGCYTLGWQSPHLSDEQRKHLFAMVCRLVPHHSSAIHVINPILQEALSPETFREGHQQPEATQRLLNLIVTLSQYIQHWPLEAKKMLEAKLTKALEMALWQQHLELLWVMLRLQQRLLKHPQIKNEAGVKQFAKWQQYLSGKSAQGVATANFVKQLLSV